MKKIIIFAAALLPLLLTSCDENEQFRGELYKKVIYLLSTDDYTFQSEHELGEQTTGYVTVYCGGTEHINKDVTVTLERDDEAMSEYNHMYYDIDESRYAHELDPSQYKIERCARKPWSFRQFRKCCTRGRGRTRSGSSRGRTT